MDLESIISLLNNICNSSTVNDLHIIAQKINVSIDKTNFNKAKYELVYLILSDKKFLTPFSNSYYHIITIYIPKLDEENKNLFNNVYGKILDIYDDKWNRWSYSTEHC